MCNSCSHAPERPDWARSEVSDDALDELSLSRRRLMQAAAAIAGTMALGAAGTSQAPAAMAAPIAPRVNNTGEYDYLVGDHHVHSQYSYDAKYKISMQLDNAEKFGLDWMAFTDHSNIGYANRGGLLNSHAEIVRERGARPNLMIFQGLEWWIPGAEHGTLLVPPCTNDTRLIRLFQLAHDGRLNGMEKPERGTQQEQDWEAKAVKAIQWLKTQRDNGFVDDIVVLANHPMRLGINSPHEMRAWRDAAPELFIGMEGAPGAQSYAYATNVDPGDVRGEYTNGPGGSYGQSTYLGYAEALYKTFGGFDSMTALVGGLWDSMLAEGKPFWITSNSDNHLTARDTWRFDETKYPDTPAYQAAGSERKKYEVAGRRPDPVATNTPQGGSDFWPGQFSRTHTGVTERSYRGVLDAMRAGRMWVDHGHLINGFEARVRVVGSAERGVTLGGRLQAPKGSDIEIELTVTPTTYANSFGITPKLAHLDIIEGLVTGPVTDPDTLTTPNTKVREQIDTSSNGSEPFTIKRVLRGVDSSRYVRFRGSDGRRNGPGYYGADIDPAGPQPHGYDVSSTADEGNPWLDTWFYSNPIFIDVK